MKKWLITLCLTFVVLLCLNYVRITIDKDSVYTAHIPNTMRVAHIQNSDKGIKIYVDKQPVQKEIGEHDVLVQVKSASFSNRDFNLIKQNKNKEFVPCSDFAGKVVKVGSAVKDYEIGDPVFGIADITQQNGACADYVKIPENNINDIPYSLSYKQASAIPTPALLNWFALHNIEKKGLKKGKVLIDDAISETGIMLTGLLVRNGFEVSAIDEEQLRNMAKNYGIQQFISVENFNNEKQSLLNQFDVVINLKGATPSKDLIELVKPEGTFISFDKTSATRTNIKMLIIDNKKIDNEIFAKMARLVHLGKIQIKVAKEFGLEKIKNAYLTAEKGNSNGKVVVVVNK